MSADPLPTAGAGYLLDRQLVRALDGLVFAHKRECDVRMWTAADPGCRISTRSEAYDAAATGTASIAKCYD